MLFLFQVWNGGLGAKKTYRFDTINMERSIDCSGEKKEIDDNIFMHAVSKVVSILITKFCTMTTLFWFTGKPYFEISTFSRFDKWFWLISTVWLSDVPRAHSDSLNWINSLITFEGVMLEWIVLRLRLITQLTVSLQEEQFGQNKTKVMKTFKRVMKIRIS